MTRIRVLFADDQFPYDEAERNTSVKAAILAEIGDKLRAKNLDPEFAFLEDFNWFQGLRQHLRERFEVLPARTFMEAKATLYERDNFDVAVIDLSWSGDAQIPSGQRHNVGIELLEILQEQNDKHRGYKPVLAFSQNFEKDPKLMSLVLDRGALPVPKAYSETGYQALSSAISYLAKVRPPGSTTEDPSVAAARVTRTGAIIIALITGILGLLGGISTAIISSNVPPPPVETP
ncbi:hypothetical protein N836_00390 [Leptolyngbya sp. Heron Island J]|uniref:hypothetical protein n=1 Tax=Leptolyngbya sp. Heron Island J TaxID=1385935 RepID=UPI0003B9D90F|nr:hypothetical protein [Leptolyngbya sp. Heron Island J]ESA36364.1 hypothetical protein N836_00390 [Leptolyngbya sp. Heron Island J]